MKKFASVFLAGLMAAAFAAGCGKARSGKRALAFVTNGAADFWTIARRGCEKADAELPDVSVDFKIPGDASAAEQKRIFEDLLARGVAGIAISPINPEHATKMLNDAAKNTLIITHDSDAPQSDRVCYIGTDNTAAGEMAGELLKKALPQGGGVMLFVGKRDNANAIERMTGIQNAIKDSNVTIIDVRTDDFDRVRAKANVEDTLVKHPDVAGLVGLYSYNGPAIYEAVKAAGKAGQVRIVCFDEEPDALAGVREGAIFATVVQQPFEFGYQSIHLMNNYLDGKTEVVPPSRKIIVPTKAITRENVEEFMAEMKKLLGK